jgi:hypothetical protein
LVGRKPKAVSAQETGTGQRNEEKEAVNSEEIAVAVNPKENRECPHIDGGGWIKPLILALVQC